MKTFFLLSFLLLVTCTFCQNSPLKEIPRQLISSFKEKFPVAASPRWMMINNETYKVTFFSNNTKNAATFDTVGKWKSTEIKIRSTRKLPFEIENGFFKSQFSTWYIESIIEYKLPEKTYFKFVVNNGPLLDGDHHDAFLERQLLEFSSNGKIISKNVIR